MQARAVAVSKTASLADSVKTARLTVTCLEPVQVDGLVNTAKAGTGTVLVTAGFAVTPAAARCIRRGVGDRR